MGVNIPPLSIVIPTYGRKGADLTDNLLNSLITSGLRHPMDFSPEHASLMPTEIVVVDDGSDDETQEILKIICTKHGVAKLVSNRPNTAHFARNVNLGIMETSGDTVFIINNDITLEPGCLQTLYGALTGMNLGMVAPKLIYPDSKDLPEQFRNRIQFGGMVHIKNTAMPTHHGWFDHAFRFAPRYHVGASTFHEGLLTGALLGIRRATIDMVGLLDERFELTCEDVDYCLRVMLSGLSCAYVGAAEAIHHEGATRGNTEDGKLAHPEWTEKEARSLDFLFDKWPLVQWNGFNGFAG